MADFKIKVAPQVLRTRRIEKDPATLINPGKFVEIDSVTGLAQEADASSVAVAYTELGSAVGETIVEVSEGNDFTLVGTSDAASAQTDAGIVCDVVISGSDQQIDIGTSSTDVLKVSPDVTGLNVGETENIEVRINKPLF